jgi:V/A-type H+/Na+-transporting ATPase subunit G/H
MPSVETLREIKRAEEEVQRIRAKAKDDAERTLRDAAREADTLKLQAEQDASRAFDAGVEQARREVDREKQQLLAKGEQDARAIAAKAQGPELNRAVDILLKKFDQRVRG